MAKIEIDGTAYKVLESLGFNHDIGGYAKEVEVDGKPKMAVKRRGGVWRFWTPLDRIAPLLQRRPGGGRYV